MISTRIAKTAAVLTVSLGALLLTSATAATASAPDAAAVSTTPTPLPSATTDSLSWG
ncbi:hypothetical protein ACIQF6_33800 [Kitasatospora sp. NPDC092948]|uniref:hypothetical protein n=1 Tax=Kitasatospora sp. NPDC092948 TaxID=3364088 RepID=UPI003821F2BB